MKKCRFYSKGCISLLVLPFFLVSAQASAAILPDSGTALEGVKPPPAQQQAPQGPDITVQEAQPENPDTGQEKIWVKDFRFCGELPVAQQELEKCLAGSAGQEMSLHRLNQLADKLTRYLRQRGYLVAFAYIPAQTLRDGSVEIAIVSGKYEKIDISGTVGIAPERLKSMLPAARSGKIIRRQELEHDLLLINDLNGIAVQASLGPGQKPGTADLTLHAASTAGASGVVYMDNWGNRYSGQIRSGVQYSLNNPGRLGDRLDIGGLLTEDKRMGDYNLSYSLPLGYRGLRLTLGHSRVHYTLGDEFAALDANGEAVTDNLTLAYPLVRSRNVNLMGAISYDHKKLSDDTNSSAASPRTSRLGNAALNGSFVDSWLGGGNNSFSLTRYWGNLSGGDSSMAAASHFNKTVFNFERQQYVARNLTFAFSFIGQLADGNLDSSEKLYLGGADGVRAYPQGEAAGDQGYRLSGEFRWRLPGLSKQSSSVCLTSFYDYGSVILDKHPSAAGDNRRSLAGAGLGMLWTRDNDFMLRLAYAWKTGREKAQSDHDKNGRFWIQGVKYF